MNILTKFLLLCIIALFTNIANAQLYINELMADNSASIVDENGDYEDWIEIYNAGATPVDIGGYYISDDLTTLTPWQIPTTNANLTTIAPGGFILLWADKDSEDGVLHLDFKLSGDGEDIIFIAADGSTVIDQLTFGPQGSNISYGRTLDGGPDFQQFLSPTPGSSNEGPLSPMTFSATINTIVQTVNDNGLEYGNGSGGVLLDPFGMTITESWSNQTIGLRFSNILLPQGSSINSAHIQFTTKNPDNSTGASNLQIQGELSPDAQPFQETNFNLSDRPLTTGSIGWQPDEWNIEDFAGEEQKTPNLGPVIQEVLSQSSWQSGNALAFIITGDGQRSAHNYTSGFPSTLSIQAEIPVPTSAINNLYINEVAPFGTEYPDENGKYSDWIEIYNSNNIPVSLGGLFLTDDLDNLSKWQIGSIETIPANGHLIIRADEKPELGGFHAAFKLSKNGETLALVQALNNELIIIDSMSFGAIPFKASFGRSSDGANDFSLFGAPTPAASNANTLAWLSPPNIDLDNGVFSSPQMATISHSDPQAIIRYTLDGSEPNENSALYSNDITIDHTQSIRARAYKTGSAPSQIETKNYLFDASATLPVLMITTDPDNLFDDEIGIYTEGTNGISVGFCSDSIPANFWQDWERPANFTLFETSGATAFSVDAGIKISGNCSRKYALKSFNVYLRSNQYGDESINYQLFPDRDFEEYERFRLRNSGQDYRSTMMRDGLNQKILAEVTDVEYQNYRPTLVYINGVYWGIQNFRDLYGSEYFDDLFDVDPKKLELLKRPRVDTEIKEGDDIHYNNLYDFMAEMDLSETSNFEYVQTQLEVDNFLDYWISMLYMSNADWPSNNVQIWRPKKQTGKWRYMYADTDNTTNLYGDTSPNGHTWDRIEEVLDPTLTGWPNDNRATLPFRRIMENQAFEDEFIQRSCSFIELIFNTDRTNAIIDAAAAEIDGEIGQHVARWAFDNPFLTEYDDWASNVSKYRAFFEMRPDFFYDQLSTNFDLTTTYELSFNYDEDTNGDVFIHWKNMEIPYDYTGTYFTGLPIRATAVAKEGYVFSHWLETGDTTAVLEFIGNSDASLTPVFEIAESTDGLSENTIEANINLYPNPSKGVLFVEGPGLIGEKVYLTIYNQLGQLIQSEQINGLSETAHRVKLNNIANGFYYLVLKTETGNSKTRKFVLRR